MKKGENVKVYAISVDASDASKTLAEKIASDGHGAINFPLLSDKEHRVIDAYGLHDPAYDGHEFDGIPKAAVYVIDKNGVVRWSRVETDYRERPTNEQIRAAIDSLK